MLHSPCASFHSLEQYQVYCALRIPGHIVLNVAATGSGKTLPYQLLMHSISPPARSVMILPYNVLHAEMTSRMRAVGLSVKSYHRGQPFPDAAIVLASLESLDHGNDLYHAMQQEQAVGHLKCIAIDEAHESEIICSSKSS
jgi:replicative superfamily II helicase